MQVYDVVVIGGGPAGTVAAMAAARMGVSVLLVEQYGCLGGALTMAGTGPQMSFHAGRTQVVRGIAEEIVSCMKKHGYSPGHMKDFNGYCSSVTPFDAEGLKYILEQMVLEAGVRILYHTVYTGCDVVDGHITCVHLYSKNGFFDVSASVYIDGSADADLAFHAGVPCKYGREKDFQAQPMTMNFKIGNCDRNKIMDYVIQNKDDMSPGVPFAELRDIPRTGIQGAYDLIRFLRDKGELHLDRDRILCFETNNEGEFIVNMSRVGMKNPLEAEDLTYAEIEGRRQVFEIHEILKKHVPGFEHSRIVSSGPVIGVRESRRIVGTYVLTAEDLVSNRMFSDAVAMGGYPIDIHSPNESGSDTVFLAPGSWYSIPYRSLTAKEIDNLIVVGRCISATHEACAAIRVTPIVMAVAQGGGTAAAMASLHGLDVKDIDAHVLRNTLRENGAFLDEC